MARYNDQRDTSFYEDLPLEDTVADNLSILPLSKDSFGVCELCGRVGRREDFCIKNNRFCSQHCYLSFKRRQNCNWKFKIMEGTEHMEGMIPLEPLPQLQSWHASFTDLQARPIKPSAAIVANSYEWKDELFGSDFLAAPVSLFKHAPLHEMWDNTFEGMKVEVKNTDCDNKSEKLGDFFWVATVLKVKGYMGLLRYEGFGSDDSKDFWVNLCCSEVHPVGWCATRGKPLIPPKSIEEKYTDWKKFLVKTLTGARTLPANFYSKLNESLKSRFSVGTIMEVVDKNRISQVKVASVYEIIGKRLHVKYYDSSPEDNGFWCHEDSPLIHPVGWAFRVGHPLDAPAAYCQRVAAGRISPSDATLDMFCVQPAIDTPLFSEGMKLEAIDPLNLSSVCAATVMQILNDGYMMIRIDFYPADASGGDWFCYHQRSPCIFPVGFAMANNITLVPPAGYTAPHFSWEQYLAQCGARAAGRELFAARGHVVSHGFVAGMRLECADLMDPRLVCVATVARLVADLLKVHFDGWGDEYDQWLWAHSTDMYPVGWSRAVGHRLEGPLQPPPRPPRQAKRPTKPRPPKRRKRPPALPIISQPCNTAEDSSQHSDMGDNKNLSPMTSLSEISADIDTRHSEISADIDTRHSEISADIDTRHSELSADMDTRHSELSADMDTRHSEISADMDMRQSEISADLDMRQSEISADLDMRHPEISADLDMRHSEVSADIETRHSEMSDTNDVSMEADSKEYNSIMESDRDADATSESNDPPPESETTPMEIPITTVPMPEMPSPHPHYSDTSSPQLPETPLQPEDMDSNSPQQDYEETESIRTELEQHIEPTQNDKLIPRLVNNSLPLDVLNSIEPEQWTIADVAKFLTINDCQPYCEYFSKIDGPAMLKLSKDEIIELLQMKVGPSLKIFDLIHQLRFKMKQPKRLLGNFK